MRTVTGNAPTRLFIAALALSLLAPSLVEAAPAVRVVPTDIRDTRSTDDFFAGLKVKAKLVGDVMADAKGVRTKVTAATDSTGRSLIKSQQDEDPGSFDETKGSSTEITMEMASPSRAASTVHEVTGTIEIFVPKRDPAARITVDSVLQHTGTPLQAGGLQAVGIQMMVLNRDEYVAYKKKQEAEKAADKKDDKNDLGTALVAGLGKAFIEMFGGSDDMGPNDIALTFSDPNSRLVSAEFEDAAGKAIDPDSRMTTGGSQTFSFTKPLPATARLRLFVLTPTSVIKVPFSLSDVPLP